MHCNQCDALLPEGAQFCIICGAPVSAGQAGATQRLGPADHYGVEPGMVTSAFTLPGYRIVRAYGIVRGLTVRSASIGGQFAAAWKQIVGGNVGAMIKVCEHARTEAFLMTLDHAAQLGANAIVGFAYDTTEIGQGITEVLAYGTAVLVEPDRTA
jgi:uncharacterized protein YbjQ (UPF0145 family)